ncbi:MAG: tRNA epoxyqueuosine(34) reductase QueG [Bacteroidales bacterium]|jgi:epoxyqueuosine reductase|nr:tRNA epoxyqueuosine(34) reductase QueG [Bacteroidales bacterium]
MKDYAFRLGFSGIGIAGAGALVEARQQFEQSIALGFHADMLYLARETGHRFLPTRLLAGCQSVIVCLYDYRLPLELQSRYKVARYAQLKDYHIFMREKLEALAAFVHAGTTGEQYKITVDTSPLSEKQWAVQAGLGHLGKNGLLLSSSGSYCFIGIILTTLHLPTTEPAALAERQDPCGSCRLCVEACPAGALHEPYRVDARRCIAYHTVEYKGTGEHFPKIQCSPWIFGCDRCQEVCPRNRALSYPTDAQRYQAPFLHFTDSDWENLTSEQFQRYFSGTCLQRRGYEKIRVAISRDKE